MFHARQKMIVLPPVHPNAGLEVAYRKKLYALIDQMHRSVHYWVKAAYRANQPEIAQDESPAMAMRRLMRRLTTRWNREFAKLAREFAPSFVARNGRLSDAAFALKLRNAGFTVGFQVTRTVNDVMQASIGENVALIKSIPERYLTNVEGMVLRSVQAGRDLGALSKDLEEQYGVTRRRAALIARDQNNKATSVINRARQIELGITEAVWKHSHAGKVPRPTHVAMSDHTYDVTKGMWDEDEGEWVFPGQLVNCFPGDSRIDFAGNVEVAYRRRYRGELISLITASGKTLRGTPNHPILTPRGWVALQHLQHTDYVLEISDNIVGLTVEEGYVHRTAPILTEVFATCLQSGSVRSEVSKRRDFHGDGANGDIDVVAPAGGLRFGRETLLQERCKNLSLSMPDDLGLSLSLADQFLFGDYHSTTCRMGAGRKTFSSFDTFGGHTNEVGLRSSANFATSRDDAPSDSVTRDFIPLGKRENTFSGFMFRSQLSRVIHIERESFDGHVFNLGTNIGWYVTEGIVTHNCRCTSRSVIRGFI